MKFVTSVILTAIAAALLQSFFPWWTAAVAAFVIALIWRQKPTRSFLSGFLGVGLLWLFYSLWIDHNNNHILTTRMAELLHFKSTVLLFVITSLLGATVSGLAALSASFLKPIK